MALKIAWMLSLLLVAFGLLALAYRLITGVSIRDLWRKEKMVYDVTLEAELKE